MSDIAFQPLTKLAGKIADGEIGAVELFDHYAARIEAHNGALNAIVAMDLDAGRERRKTCRCRRASDGSARCTACP